MVWSTGDPGPPEPTVASFLRTALGSLNAGDQQRCMVSMRTPAGNLAAKPPIRTIDLCGRWRRVLHASTRGVGHKKIRVRWPDPPHDTVE
eukprot:gene11118-biopygen15388